MVDFTNKRILIVAATGTIGRALATYLYQHGAHLVLTGRSKRRLEKLHDSLKALKETEQEITLIPLDLMQFDQIDQMGALLFHRFGLIDGFISAAGYLKELGPVAHFNRDYFDKMMAIQVTAHFRLIQNMHLLFGKAKSPRAVFLTSQEQRDKPFWGIYQTGKAALEAMVVSYAMENKNSKIKANLIDPLRVSSHIRDQAYPGEADHKYPVSDAFLEKVSQLLDENTSTGQVIKCQIQQLKAA